MEFAAAGLGPTSETMPVIPAGVGPDPRRWSILVIVVIAQLMVVLDASIVTIALPSIQRALNMSVANRQWVITAYTLLFGGLLLAIRARRSGARVLCGLCGRGGNRGGGRDRQCHSGQCEGERSFESRRIARNRRGVDGRGLAEAAPNPR
jgi:hypothetical protein